MNFVNFGCVAHPACRVFHDGWSSFGLMVLFMRRNSSALIVCNSVSCRIAHLLSLLSHGVDLAVVRGVGCRQALPDVLCFHGDSAAAFSY